MGAVSAREQKEHPSQPRGVLASVVTLDATVWIGISRVMELMCVIQPLYVFTYANAQDNRRSTFCLARKKNRDTINRKRHRTLAFGNGGRSGMAHSKMRFYVISDLHFTKEGISNSLLDDVAKFCTDIRRSTPPGTTALFIILGDILFHGDTLAFGKAEEFFHYIQTKLSDLDVRFEFVPGNHDWANGEIKQYNQFIANYNVAPFSDGSAYAREYGGVNFIFANSTQEDYHKPGKLELEKIRALICSDLQNVLCCHHGLSQSYGDEHNVIENSAEVQQELSSMGIKMVIHGHVHQAEGKELSSGVWEIGCGSFSADLKDMDRVYNQFAVGYLWGGEVRCIERWILVGDGNGNFAQSALYPQAKDYTDPADKNKIRYEIPSSYIARKIMPHEIFLKGPFEQSLLYHDSAVNLETALKEHLHILLLSDAGMGKSIEMKYLAAKMYSTSFFPFRFSLCNYRGGGLKALMPSEYQGMHPGRWLLLMDGYDEMQKELRNEFRCQLSLFLDEEANSSARIVITSRSNFCKTEQKGESHTLEGFATFDLQPLEWDDINAYLEQNELDSEEFHRSARQANVSQLLKNPFYLTRLTGLFQKNRSLPGRHKVMEELVENCFDRDDKKFSVEDLEEQFQEQQKALMKIALGMQLMQKQELDDREEYQELFGANARRPVRFSSLIHKTGSSWSFTHNNFREYFVAKCMTVLPQDKVISYLYDGQGIRDNWVNVLAYLSEMELDWDLYGWLAQYAPTAYVKFEPERLSDEVKFRTFQHIFQEAEEKRLWIDSELCTVEELAHFACTPEVLDYLLERIKHPVHTVSQLSALAILEYWPKLFGRDDEVRQILLDGCFSEESGTAAHCIHALMQQRLASPDATGQLVAYYRDSADSTTRWELYQLLHKTGQQDAHVNFFLSGIAHLGGNGRMINEQMALVDGLSSLSQPVSIIKAIKHLTADQTARLYRREKILQALCTTAVEQYQDGREAYYEEMLECYIFAAKTAYFDSSTQILFSFFEQTKTDEQATIELCNRYGSESNMLRALFMEGKRINYVQRAYMEDRLFAPNLFAELLKTFADDDQYEEYRQLIGLPERPPKVNYAQKRKEAKAEYVSALFDKRLAQALLDQLLETVGMGDGTIEAVASAYEKVSYHSSLSLLQHALSRYDRPEVMAKDFFTGMDWDCFTCSETMEMIKHYGYRNITNKQKEALSQAVQRVLEHNILIEGIRFRRDTCSVAAAAQAVVFLISYFNFQVAQKYLLQMLPFPDIYFAKGDTEGKYAFLEAHLPQTLLLQQVVEGVQEGCVQGFILTEYIEYCTKQKSPAIKETAISLFRDEHTGDRTKYAVIDYLCAVVGIKCVEDVILPDATEEQLLQVAHKCPNISKEMLKAAMEQQFSEASSYEIMKYLITMGSDMALAAYIDRSRQKMMPCEQTKFFSGGPTEAIKTVKAPQFLPRLKELAELLFDPAFQDREFSPLSSNLSDAFFHCGIAEPQETRIILEDLRRTHQENDKAVRFCSYTLERMAKEFRQQSNRPMAIKQAKKILCQIEQVYI